MYCVVMALAERNLYVALKQDVVGQNMDTVRYVFTQLVRDVDHMHSKGMLHADIKPLNIVRMGGKWLLIDLDAACHMHEEVPYQPSHQFRFLHLSVFLTCQSFLHFGTCRRLGKRRCRPPSRLRRVSG